MINAEIRTFIERATTAVIVSTDGKGEPHLALGVVGTGNEDDLLVFENWLCRRTLENVGANPRVAVAVIIPEERTGYQFSGRVVKVHEEAMMDGHLAGEKPSGDLQAISRLIIRVEKVVAFCSGLHLDAR